MSVIRIASFNVENLFSRAKVLNLQDQTIAGNALATIGKLQNLLKKSKYTASVKADILDAYKNVKQYIDIRENRGGKLFNRAKTAVVAGGVDDWDGEIAFKRAKMSEIARNNTAKVLKELKADVVCVVEAEDRPSLKAFNSEMLGNRKFDYALLIDGNDQRGIDVGLLSKFEPINVRTHMFDEDSEGTIFSRDCLEVEIKISDSRSLHLLCNHLKSQGYGSQASNDKKRKRQAERIRRILENYDLTKDWVVVAGDMNDDPTSAPLQPMLQVPDLTDVLSLQFAGSADRWTYSYRGDFQQIDYLLVSKPLKERFQSAVIERRGIYGLNRLTSGAESEFPSVDRASNAASDHAAIVAEFDLT